MIKYKDLKLAINDAWQEFFNELGLAGLDVNKIEDQMDRKDCFNDVFDAIIATVEIEEE